MLLFISGTKINKNERNFDRSKKIIYYIYTWQYVASMNSVRRGHRYNGCIHWKTLVNIGSIAHNLHMKTVET